MIAYIYALSHPETGEIRYVGKSHEPIRRRSCHIKEKKVSHKGNWIKTLLRGGLEPVVEILDEHPEQEEREWQESERFWISYLRFLGCRLTNQESGGNGGKRISEETKEKIRRANIGKKATEETLAKMRAYRASAETKAKMSAIRTGKKRSASFCEKNRNRITSDETKRKISLAKMGSKQSEKVREALRVANLGRTLSPEHLKKLNEGRRHQALSCKIRKMLRKKRR